MAKSREILKGIRDILKTLESESLSSQIDSEQKEAIGRRLSELKRRLKLIRKDADERIEDLEIDQDEIDDLIAVSDEILDSMAD